MEIKEGMEKEEELMGMEKEKVMEMEKEEEVEI